MRARQCMKMKKSKDARRTRRKWGLWSKGKPCLGSHALMPTEEYLVFGVSFFGASNSHHTHHARATRANCASPHKQAKQASQHVARNSFWCHFCPAKTTFGGLSFRRRTSFRILSAPLGSSERARRREGGPHHERTGTYAEN